MKGFLECGQCLIRGDCYSKYPEWKKVTAEQCKEMLALLANHDTKENKSNV